MLLRPNDHILFIGDSVTDGGRIRHLPGDMGRSYAAMAAALLQADNPQWNLRFTNRGIGGDRVQDLAKRWTEDVVKMKPDVLSVAIGINNTWRRFDNDQLTTTEEFETIYRGLLQKAKKALPKLRIVLCDLFALHVPADRRNWREEDLDPKIQIVRDLAGEFADAYVPFDALFAQASLEALPQYWAGDGIHPSGAGHMRMAQWWIDAVSAAEPRSAAVKRERAKAARKPASKVKTESAAVRRAKMEKAIAAQEAAKKKAEKKAATKKTAGKSAKKKTTRGK